ncbi:hypothetical protein TIFTF001_050463 [Ficus carica]|uniref:Uncharacterized protein n=1 Tax=Ficus carica TaxID=3494 RepID=A0AA87ZHD2_FICCA|nr:hypothetical protein TIFTF001_050463 [Ficus carica]
MLRQRRQGLRFLGPDSLRTNLVFSAFDNEEIEIFLAILVANLQRALAREKVDDAPLMPMRIAIFGSRFSMNQFGNSVRLARRKS